MTYELFSKLAWLFSVFTAILVANTSAGATCNPNTLQGCVITGGVTPAVVAPAPGEAYTAQAAGLFEYSKTDLTIAAPLPIQIVRTYRSYDKGTSIIKGAFGVGTTLN